LSVHERVRAQDHRDAGAAAEDPEREERRSRINHEQSEAEQCGPTTFPRFWKATTTDIEPPRMRAGTIWLMCSSGRG
jgi:hypothetical protein